MELLRKCDLCGELISIEGNVGDPPKGHLCGICYRFVCDNCIDWGASGRGFGNVCKACTSNQVILDLGKFVIPEEPVFLKGNDVTTNLDEAQQFSTEEFCFIKLKDDKLPLPIKEAIIMLQSLDETNAVNSDMDSLLSIGHPPKKLVREIRGEVKATCLCGYTFTTKFNWEENKEGFLEVRDPCPNCGKKLTLSFHGRFE